MNKGTSTAPAFPYIQQIATPGYLTKYSDKANSSTLSASASYEISLSPRSANKFISLRNPNYLNRSFRISQMVSQSVISTQVEKSPDLPKREEESDIPTFVYDLLGEEVKPRLKARSTFRDRFKSLIQESKSLNPKNNSFLITQQEPTAKTAEIPGLRYKAMLREKKAGDRMYEDYSVGGSMYNKNVEKPLYQPTVIRISPRSSVRIFTTNPVKQRQESGLKRIERLGQASTARYTASRKSSAAKDRASSPVGSKGLQDLVKPVEVDKPARTFAEKISRIRKLALDEDLSDLKDIMNRTVF